MGFEVSPPDWCTGPQNPLLNLKTADRTCELSKSGRLTRDKRVQQATALIGYRASTRYLTDLKPAAVLARLAQ
jgi:hypothetical protein